MKIFVYSPTGEDGATYENAGDYWHADDDSLYIFSAKPNLDDDDDIQSKLIAYLKPEFWGAYEVEHGDVDGDSQD